MRGTLLNTGTVLVGATLGTLAGKAVPTEYQDVALHGLGLVVTGLAIKMFLGTKNPLVAAVALPLGGIIGLLLHLQVGVTALAAWSQSHLGGGPNFVTGMIASFVLFCVGPMTLLGCLEDGLDGKIGILSVKSALDGVSSFFFAAAAGTGILVTALLLLLFQGGLTLLARRLKRLSQNEEALAEIGAVGGAILLGSALGLLGLAQLNVTNYLPAIVLAPLLQQ